MEPFFNTVDTNSFLLPSTVAGADTEFLSDLFHEKNCPSKHIEVSKIYYYLFFEDPSHFIPWNNWIALFHTNMVNRFLHGNILMHQPLRSVLKCGIGYQHQILNSYNRQ